MCPLNKNSKQVITATFIVLIKNNRKMLDWCSKINQKYVTVILPTISYTNYCMIMFTAKRMNNLQKLITGNAQSCGLPTGPQHSVVLGISGHYLMVVEHGPAKGWKLTASMKQHLLALISFHWTIKHLTVCHYLSPKVWDLLGGWWGRGCKGVSGLSWGGVGIGMALRSCHC